MKYFIGNWKMFGVPKSIQILNKINLFYKKDKNRKKYKVFFAPPHTLIDSFSKDLKIKLISIGSQNCFYKDGFSSNTAAISPYMLKRTGARFTLVGHSDNRGEGETNKILKEKLKYALKNNLKVIFCIGENKNQKKNKKTFQILRQQLTQSIEKKFNKLNIIVAYEPIWSIGTGKLPSTKELKKTILHIKEVLKKIFKKKAPPVLYGGSVDGESVKLFKKIKEIDGFLIGGASKSSKKFIDIIKNYYR